MFGRFRRNWWRRPPELPPDAGVRAFAVAVADITFPYYIQWTLDLRVWIFMAAVCAAAALFVGLVPAVQWRQRRRSRFYLIF